MWDLLYFVNLLKYCHNLVYLHCYDKLREIHIGIFCGTCYIPQLRLVISSGRVRILENRFQLVPAQAHL